MIVVTRKQNGITIKGHAGYAEPGKDIVCAAVSILTQTLIKSFEDITAAKIKYSISPGTADIKYRDLTGSAHTLLNSFFIGIKMLADEYPEYVQLTEP